MTAETKAQTNANNTQKSEPAETAPSARAYTAAKKPVVKKGASGRVSARRRTAPEQKDEFDQRVIQVRRVARVVAGGRRFSFSVVVVVGNRKGAVGVGLGKAADTSLAIQKAVRHAKKNLITVPLTRMHSIPHSVEAKYCSARVLIKPKKTSGLIAGSAVRTVLDLAGVRAASAKIISRSKNKLNNARATMQALRSLQPAK